MKYALKKPIKVLAKAGADGAEVEREITELVFREEIVAGDMRGIPVRDPMYFEDILKIAGRLCGQPDHVMHKLSLADLGEVVELVGGFTGAGRATGTEQLVS